MRSLRIFSTACYMGDWLDSRCHEPRKLLEGKQTFFIAQQNPQPVAGEVGDPSR
jgi:hypothetical protein